MVAACKVVRTYDANNAVSERILLGCAEVAESGRHSSWTSRTSITEGW